MTGTGYLAIVGKITDAARARLRRVPDFTVVLDTASLIVSCSAGSDLIDFGSDRGAIVGTMFDRAGRAPLTRLDEASISAALASDGATLFRSFWGSYTAFLRDPDGRVRILRDPSGGVSCYFSERDGACLVASDVRQATAHGLMTPAVDYEAVAQFLLWPERRTSRTCLADVYELMHGQRLTSTLGTIELATPWTPWQFAAREQQFEMRDEAVELVRRTTLNTLSTWRSRYSQPLISLSGGLDSSIVLAGTRSPAAAITFTTGEPLGDERRYAGAAADACNVALLEQPLELESIDPARSDAASFPRPIGRLFGQELDHEWRAAARLVNADALFHGGGGDSVFCYLASATPYLDSLLIRGPSRATGDVLASLSRMTRVSTWRIRRAALRKVIMDRGNYRWVCDRRMLSRQAIKTGRSVRNHPWFDLLPRGVLPGKRAHVAALLRIQNYLEATEPQRIVPVVAPLMSQPMLETCLRVPTWMWCVDGMNRAVARDAFRDLLPPVVVDRRGKGSPAAFDARIVAKHREQIRAMLRDGILARARLIDGTQVDTALVKTGPLRGELYQRVTELVDVEAWLQSWAGPALASDRAQS